jgi:hypothetical protein
VFAVGVLVAVFAADREPGLRFDMRTATKAMGVV